MGVWKAGWCLISSKNGRVKLCDGKASCASSVFAYFFWIPFRKLNFPMSRQNYFCMLEIFSRYLIRDFSWA